MAAVHCNSLLRVLDEMSDKDHFRFSYLAAELDVAPVVTRKDKVLKNAVPDYLHFARDGLIAWVVRVVPDVVERRVPPRRSVLFKRRSRLTHNLVQSRTSRPIMPQETLLPPSATTPLPPAGLGIQAPGAGLPRRRGHHALPPGEVLL
jgi:hypothetical protein